MKDIRNMIKCLKTAKIAEAIDRKKHEELVDLKSKTLHLSKNTQVLKIMTTKFSSKIVGN